MVTKVSTPSQLPREIKIQIMSFLSYETLPPLPKADRITTLEAATSLTWPQLEAYFTLTKTRSLPPKMAERITVLELDNYVEELVRSCTKLRKLTILNGPIPSLPPSCTTLNLRGNQHITDAKLVAFRGKKFELLDLSSCPGISGTGLRHLHCQTLLLQHSNSYVHGIRHLPHDCQTLDLSDDKHKINSQFYPVAMCLENLANHNPHLQHITLPDHTKLTGEAFRKQHGSSLPGRVARIALDQIDTLVAVGTSLYAGYPISGLVLSALYFLGKGVRGAISEYIYTP